MSEDYRDRHINAYDPDAPTPEVGSRWVWEPDKPHASERIVVGEVLWNGEEWWVRTDADKGQFWNSLSRFWEAVVVDGTGVSPESQIAALAALDEAVKR